MVAKKILLILLLLGALYLKSFSQIQYKISLLNGVDLYQVSLISSQDFNYPNNIIGSAQVSIKTPSASFSLGAVNSLMSDIEWANNVTIVSPEEAEDYQYLSFVIENTGVDFLLKKGIELPLFTFKNKLGSCAGAVALIDNDTEVFLPPNSRNANIGNQITPFGCLNLSNKNAYIGNIAGGVADCFLSTSLAELENQPTLYLALSPNPTENWLNITINTNVLNEDIELQLWHTDGQLIQTKRLEQSLDNSMQLDFDVNALPTGTYFIRLIQGNHHITKNFVKALN